MASSSSVSVPAPPSATRKPLRIHLRNLTDHPTVYAYITGFDPTRNLQFFVGDNGKNLVYPGTTSHRDIPAIQLPRPNSMQSTCVEIATRFYSGRIFFSLDTPLKLSMQPPASGSSDPSAFVEPEPTSDNPNRLTTQYLTNLSFDKQRGLSMTLNRVGPFTIPISVTLRGPKNWLAKHVAGSIPRNEKEAASYEGLVSDELVDHELGTLIVCVGGVYDGKSIPPSVFPGEDPDPSSLVIETIEE